MSIYGFSNQRKKSILGLGRGKINALMSNVPKKTPKHPKMLQGTAPNHQRIYLWPGVFMLNFDPFLLPIFHLLFTKTCYFCSANHTHIFNILLIISRKRGETSDGHPPRCLSSGQASASRWGPSRELPAASRSRAHSLQTSQRTGRGRWWWYKELQRWDAQQPKFSQQSFGRLIEDFSISCHATCWRPCVFPILSSLNILTPDACLAPMCSSLSTSKRYYYSPLYRGAEFGSG